jgi:Peptidase family M23
MKKIMFFILGFVILASRAFALELDLPVSCDIGRDCWVQQYVDHDAGAGSADHVCGTVSYDGHDGTDFRVRDTNSKINVIAAADGVVVGMRDGMKDHLVRSEDDVKAVATVECGNGVLLRHDDGYQTQYCHMAQGSVAVKNGDVVKRGGILGDVGFSGKAAFPHLHFKVSKMGKVLDPFAGACDKDDADLWSAAAKKEAAYAASDVLHFGWHNKAVTLAELEEGQFQALSPEANWPALVAAVWMINLKAGDEVVLKITGPEGFAVENNETLTRNKAQYFLFAGKTLKTEGWARGIYNAQIDVTNGGQSRLHQIIDVEIN